MGTISSKGLTILWSSIRGEIADEAKPTREQMHKRLQMHGVFLSYRSITVSNRLRFENVDKSWEVDVFGLYQNTKQDSVIMQLSLCIEVVYAIKIDLLHQY